MPSGAAASEVVSEEVKHQSKLGGLEEGRCPAPRGCCPDFNGRQPDYSTIPSPPRLSMCLQRVLPE